MPPRLHRLLAVAPLCVACSGSTTVELLPIGDGPGGGGSGAAPSEDFVTAGGIQRIDLPGNLNEGVVESEDRAYFAVERRDFVLPGQAPFDLHVPGRYSRFPAQRGQLAAGTRINAYFFHYDAVGSVNPRSVAFSVTFPLDVLAVVASDENMDAADELLGSSSTSYPTNLRARGLEEDEDGLEFQIDRRTVVAQCDAQGAVDSFRVLTVSSPSDRVLVAAGAVTLVAPPQALTQGSMEGGQPVLFLEQKATLVAPLSADVLAPGTYTDEGDVRGVTVAAGQEVLSYLVHFDPVGQDTVAITRGSITFPGSILGVIISAGGLVASDELASPSTVYPGTDDDTRGLELESDRLSISRDGRSLWFELTNQLSVDQIRVLISAG